ncbi:MAG: PilZ domain-containing protein [Candidatus Omnitrophota bacterium]
MEWNSQEKRKSPRLEFPCKITIFNKKQMLSSHTEDISRGGMKVILEEKIDVSTDVHIDIFLTKDKHIQCSGKVKWVKDIGIAVQPNMFETGIAFDKVSEISNLYIEDLIAVISARRKTERKK